ncbi:hypothetical protein [Pleionea litopenaei]|uniref:Uncharacterized protein n=1 Tax=Pleionea litopenaei TaxID=3070815 RepID=A0AA51X8G7_9GAMM|nr:hypothetical protein [Pleionea sp. HL-JVS1]WMS88961.1 hypothetical protein Q9312_08605 [Pleionea sp. HL-JVS1]
MKNLILILISVVLISACKSSVDKPNIWSRAGSIAPKQFVEGEGLLVIGINPRAMNNKFKVSNKSERLISFSVKNISTGFVKIIQYTPGKSAVVTLPSGRYCLNSFNTYINLKLNHCKAPYFDVEADSVENGGITTIGVNYDANQNKVVHKIIDVDRSINMFGETLLSSDKLRIEEFYREHSFLSFPKVFYIKTPFGADNIVRLYEDGRGELQKYAQNQPYYKKGTWVKVGKEYVLSFYRGDLTYRVFDNGGTVVGLVSSKFVTNKPWSNVVENWLIVGTRTLTDANVNFSVFEHPYIVVDPGVAYPKAAYLSGETGVVELSFGLEKEHTSLNVYKPINISIESSSIKSVYAQTILESFRKYRYSLPKDVANKKFKEKVTLRITDDVPSVSFENSPVIYFNRYTN